MKKSLLSLITLLACTPLAAQDISFKSTPVAEGLFMIEGVGGFAGGNLGLSIGEDGVVLIDDSMAPLNDKMMAAIAEVTDQNVDYVINTHIHGDHTGGNVAMHNHGATIVAHENIRQRLLDDGIATRNGQTEAPIESLPQVTFTDAMTFHLNGTEAHVFHLPNAHTDGDGAIHFRNLNVIHTGDLMFNGLFPFIDMDSGGSVQGYIAAQERLLALCNGDTVIIPGHGPLAKPKDLRASISMLKDALSRVSVLVEEGLSDDEIIEANPLADYDSDWSWGFINTERMTRQILRGVRGEAS